MPGKLSFLVVDTTSKACGVAPYIGMPTDNRYGLKWLLPLCSADRAQVVASGSLKAWFNVHNRIETLEHAISEFNEYISRPRLMSLKIESPEEKSSPNASKTAAGKKATQQRMQKQMINVVNNAVQVPPSPVGEWGVTNDVFALIEVIHASLSRSTI